VFIIGALLVGGGVYLAIDKTGLALIGATLAGYLLYLVISVTYFLEDKTGIYAFYKASWVFLSGQTDANNIFESGPICDDFGFGLVVLVLIGKLVTVVLAFVCMILGFITIFGLPVGIIGTGIGGVMSLLNRDKQPFKSGLQILVWALAAMVAAGLLMRVIATINGATTC